MKSAYRITLSLLAAASLVLAQDATSAPQGGWKPVGGTGSGQLAPDPQAAPPPADPAPPPQLTLKAGTFITLRLNQALSSDKSQAGDAFTGTLVRPIVVDGFVVAQAGQTLAGKVADAKKASQAAGVSHVNIQLTDLTLVDGQQLPVQSEVLSRTAPTKGKTTLIEPGMVMTIRIQADAAIATDRSPQAFRVVGPNQYSQPQIQAGRPGGYAPNGYAPAPYAAYPPYAYGYPYYGYPYYYGGPGLYLGFGGFYGGRFGFRGRFR